MKTKTIRYKCIQSKADRSWIVRVPFSDRSMIVKRDQDGNFIMTDTVHVHNVLPVITP